MADEGDYVRLSTDDLSPTVDKDEDVHLALLRKASKARRASMSTYIRDPLEALADAKTKRIKKQIIIKGRA